MRVYFDHNATTPVRPEAMAVLTEVMTEVGNPSAMHVQGQAARRRVEKAREQVAAALCTRAQDVVFTSGGTEGANLALHSMVKAGGAKRLLVSAIEHSAVSVCAAATGLPVETFPVTGAGIADLDWLTRRLADWDAETDGAPALAIMLASNETGVIQPVGEIAQQVRALGGLVLVDATQAVGKIPVDFAATGAHYLALSAHKFGGPQGIGALLVACDAPFAPHHHGGGQEKGRRPGTENVSGIAAMGAAIERAMAAMDQYAGLAEWRDEMIAAMKAEAPDLCVLGEGQDRLPNTIAFSIPGWKRENHVMAMDLAGVSISAGSACSSGKVKGSKVGAAMGLSEDLAEGVVRLSMGWNTTRQDVEQFLSVWPGAYARIADDLKVGA